MPTHVIDAEMSRFTVRGYAGGMLSALGHNPVIGIRDFKGEVCFEPEAIAEAWLRIRINATAMEVQNQVSEKDRREMKRVMDEEVLETERYPVIAFDSTTVSPAGGSGNSFRVDIEGSLRMHGGSGVQRFPAQVTVTGDSLRAFGEFTVRQSDYGIRPVAVAGGIIKLKDELKFNFDIVARRKTEG